MGVPTGILSVEQFLEIATEYGTELNQIERANKERIAREKAERAFRQTLSKREEASNLTSRILGPTNRIDPKLWTFVSLDNNVYEVRLNLHSRLRIVYKSRTASVHQKEGLYLQYKKNNGYPDSWDYNSETKPINSWDEFCKIVAAHPAPVKKAPKKSINEPYDL